MEHLYLSIAVFASITVAETLMFKRQWEYLLDQGLLLALSIQLYTMYN